MKTFKSKSIFLTLAIAALISYSAVAQRVVKGTVYREGKVAAGVTVEAHRSNEVFRTSFDGVYEIKVPDKAKYLKFTFIDDSRKLDIETNTSNVIDFSFDGVIPAAAAEANESGAILKTSAELIAAKDKDFMSSYTLEKQFYDQKDYKSAIGMWRKLYRTYPLSTINIYLHGITMYQSLIEGTSDHNLKHKYVDTLMQVYDRRIKYFDQKGYILGRQGTDYLKYNLDNEDITDAERKPILKKGYSYLEESVKLQGLESEAPVLILLMQSTRGLFGLGELGKEKVIENYDLASKIISGALAKDPGNNNFIIARDNVEQVFQSSGAADCEALISIYTPKFDQVATNIDDLKKMIRLLDRQKCDASPLYAKAADKLYQLEPSAEAAYNMARMYIKADQHDKAQDYYKLAIDAEKDPLNLSKYYYELATLNFTSSPQSAKTYLKKSIENNPSFGKPYLLLGDVYAHNSKSYGDNDFERSMVFLVAVDYYAKAKRADPTVEAEANEKISLYSQYFPAKEDIFFNGLTVGQSYSVGGWIGESTTIREKK
jgi:tetratricopeptide (TPR) repeat protein